MHQASVGFHCPECTQRGKQQVHRGPIEFDAVATKVLIGANIVIFLITTMAGGLSGQILLDFGLNAIPIAQEGEAYRILSSGVLHDGPFHILANMWSLWVVGPLVERTLGTPRFIALYFVSLAAGAFGALLLDPLAFTVGASGAIFGVFGAAFVLAQFGGHRSIGNQIGAVLAINVFITFAFPVLSIGGHIGGLIGGSALAAAYVPMLRARRPEWETLVAALIAVAVFSAGALWAASQWPDPLF